MCQSRCRRIPTIIPSRIGNLNADPMAWSTLMAIWQAARRSHSSTHRWKGRGRQRRSKGRQSATRQGRREANGLRIPFYKYIFLQRWPIPFALDAQRNPYITVDWMPIDLTTFNGEQPWDAAAPDPDDPDGDRRRWSIRQLASEAAAIRTNTPPQGTFNLWAPVADQRPLPTNRRPPDRSRRANFPNKVQHSLGYLEPGLRPGFHVANQPMTTPPSNTSAIHSGFLHGERSEGEAVSVDHMERPALCEPDGIAARAGQLAGSAVV